MPATRIAPDALRELTRREARRRMQLAVSDLPRLGGLIAPDRHCAGEDLQVTVGFREGRDARPEVSFEVAGSLPLVCQRCLQVMEHRIELAFVLAIADAREDVATLAEPFDVIAMDAEGLCLLTVIEDEILADLPIAPRHALRSACAGSAAMSRHAGGADEGTSRPFADLAALMECSEPGHTD
jgi:uncharacterized protein